MDGVAALLGGQVHFAAHRNTGTGGEIFAGSTGDLIVTITPTFTHPYEAIPPP